MRRIRPLRTLSRSLCGAADPEMQMLFANHAAVRSKRKERADTSHRTRHQTDGGVTFGSSEMRGVREKMEDVSIATLQLGAHHALFGVFDGHSGAAAARYAAEHLPSAIEEQLGQGGAPGSCVERAFAQVDASLVAAAESSGTCALVALVCRGSAGAPQSVVVGNCGDSRAALSRGEDAPLLLSHAHSPGEPAERARIEAAGGTVENVSFVVGGLRTAVDRINGRLAVSRALGDAPYKRDETRAPDAQLVSGVPELVHHEVKPGDEFLLLASDGVWDAMRPEEAVAFVRAELPLARKQCVRVLGENFGSLHVDVLTSRDVSKYAAGEPVDFPKSRDKVKGFVMKVASADGSGAGPGEVFVRPTPPEAWEGGWAGEADKARVARAWPCGIVVENLLDRCIELGSADNLSAVLVMFGERDGIGVAGNDGSTLDHLEQGHGIESSQRQKEAWQRRRNNS